MSKELVISASPHETRVAIVEDGQLCEIYVEREKELALVGSIYKGRVTRVLPGMQSAFVDIGLDSDAFLYVSDFLEELDEYDSVSTVETKVEKMEQQGGEVFAGAVSAPPAPAGAPPAEGEEAVSGEATAESPAEAAEVGEQTTEAHAGEGEAPPAAPMNRSEDLPGESRAPADPNARPVEPSRGPRDDFRRGGFRNDSRGFRGNRGDRGDRGRGGRGRGGRDRFGRGSGGGGRERFSGRRDEGRGREHGREFPASKFSTHRPYEPPEEQAPGEAHEPIILPGESLAKYKERPAVDLNSAAAISPEAGAATAAVLSEYHAVEAERGEDAAVAAPVEHIAEEHAAEAVPPETQADQPQAPAPVSSEEVAAMKEEIAASEPHFHATAEPHADEPHTEDDLTDEQAASLAEQMSEVEHERSQADVMMESVEEENGAEEAGEHDEAERTEQDGSEHREAERGETEQSAYESDETDQEIRQGILDAAADYPESESQPPAEMQPRQARVESDHRQRFQRPMRRGGSGGGGRRRGGRGDRGDRGERPRFGRPHGGHGGHRPSGASRRPQLISEMLKAGEEIIVQIAKEPLGKKGARITSHVALPGRYLVYMPTVNHIGVSRKIASSEKRSRLRHIVGDAKKPFPGGFIVRTAAETATEEEIRNDVEFLGRTWSEIRQKSEQRKAPAILHRDLNLVERILRDHLSSDYVAIWIDNEEEYTKVLEFVSRFQPQLADRVKLYTKEAHIFEEFGIQQEIDKSLRPKVWLKSGGYIVINHTEALVAIDVNTGKFVGKGSTRLEDTIVKTNLEAVKEVVRQIRLRDLGGIIVIDFIDMEERRNREKVMAALDEALRRDRAPSKALGFNEFGLVAITRKRTKQALERVLCQPCPACSGSGMVKSMPTICYEIQAEARKMAPELDGASVTLRVHPEIAKALKTRESVLIDELEKWTRKNVIIQSDPTLHWEQYDIY